MSLLRRLLIGATAVAAALLLGSGIYLRIAQADAEDAAPADGDTESLPGTSAAEAFSTSVAIPVNGAAVLRDTLVISVEAAGEAAAWRRTVLLAQVEGPLAMLRAQEGARVTAGQLLAAIDSSTYVLDLAEAEANLRNAQADFRERTLFDDRITDSIVRTQRAAAARARSGLDQTEVQVQKRRLDLQKTRIEAPFAGRIASIEAVQGAWVRTGDELLTIVDIDPIKVEVQVLENEVGYLTPGRRATVTFASLPDTRFSGRIETINPVVDQQTRTARVTVVVPNPDGKILPGMYARVALEARKFADRTLVPRAAILERDRRTMLFVYDADGQTGLAKWRYVTTGLENDSLVEIVEHRETDMVEPGEVVLVDGHYTLTHDARVRLVGSVRAAGGRPD